MTAAKLTKSNRIEGLDIIRTLAILFVVLIHGVPPDFQEPGYMNNLSGFSAVFHFTCFSIGRLGVPLFLCLSGYLLLSRNYDEAQTRKFYKRNFLSLLLTWEIWIVINDYAMSWYDDTPIHWSTILKNMLFVEPTNVFHAWYMEVILGIYLFIPHLSGTLHNIGDRELLSLVLVSYIYFFVVPTCYHLYPSPIEYRGSLDLSFSGGIYGFYLISGFLIKRYEDRIRNFSKSLLILVTLVAIVAATEAQILTTSRHIYHIWYDFCLLPIAAVSVFICLKDLKCKIFHGLVTKISICAFGIYLIHALVIMVILKYRLLHCIAVDELRIVVFSIVMFILSFAIAILIKKIPYAGKILIR